MYDFKEVFKNASVILARQNPSLYYLCKCFPVYYVDEKTGNKLASEYKDKYIIFYRDIIELTDDYNQLLSEVIATWIHEVTHILHRHVKRINALKKVNTDLSDDVFYKLANIAFDIKVDNYVRDALNSIKLRIEPKTLIDADLSIDIYKSSAEDIFYHLKKNAIVLNVKIINQDLNNENIKIKDNIIFFKNNKAMCVNEGSEKVKNAKSDAELDNCLTEILISSKNVGTLPGSFNIFITEMLQPKVDWRSKLRQMFVSWIANTYVSTFSVPSRKYDSAPGYKKFSFPKVWCFVDVSGSISQDIFNQFMSEVTSICKYSMNVVLVIWDTEVKTEYNIKGRFDKNIKFKGGGGTVFYPVIINYVNKIKPTDIMVVLTDGYWFDEEKSCDVIKRIRCKKILATTSKIIKCFDEIVEIR